MQCASMPPSRLNPERQKVSTPFVPPSKDRDEPKLTLLVKGQALALKPLLRGKAQRRKWTIKSGLEESGGPSDVPVCFRSTGHDCL